MTSQRRRVRHPGSHRHNCRRVGAIGPTRSRFAAALKGRVTIDAAVRASSVVALGAGSGLKSVTGGRLSPSGVRSSRTDISSVPETPSMAAWCILVYTATRPPTSSEMRYIPTGAAVERACVQPADLLRRVARPSPGGERDFGGRGTRCRNSRHRSNTVDPGRVARTSTAASAVGLAVTLAHQPGQRRQIERCGGDSLGSRMHRPPMWPVELWVSERQEGRVQTGELLHRLSSNLVVRTWVPLGAGHASDNPIGGTPVWPAEIHPANGTVEVAEAAGTSPGHASCGRVTFLLCPRPNGQLWSTAWPPRRDQCDASGEPAGRRRHRAR